jgi:serine protease Do
MSTRKTALFYGLLIAVSSLTVGMVVASRLGLAPLSSAQTGTFTVPPMNSAPVTGTLDAQTFRNIAREQSPTVVNIRTQSTRAGNPFGGDIPDDLLERFFGVPRDQGQAPNGRGGRPLPPAIAAGTGFIISRDGLILTNNHVVEDANEIEVFLYGDQEQSYTAKLVGRDELTDSALIQLTEMPGKPLAVAKFGDSAQMGPGDWVMAIGNPFNLAHTVSVGVISATERPFEMTDRRSTDMLQTDAAINPGNSGGPLLNLRGEVVGMNTLIYSNGRAEGNIGIGFAVPINTIRDLLPQLYTGKVVRGRIGVEVTGVPAEGFEEFGLKSRAGAIVRRVSPGGAAARSGMEAGDVITEFNGRNVPTSSDLVKMVTATKPGTSVPVKVLRDGKAVTLTLVVDELDLAAEQAAQRGGPQGGDPQVQGSESFGVTLSDLTPARARQLQLPTGRSGALVTEVDPGGPSAGALQPGDVILSVNRAPVGGAADASRALQAVPAGRFAQIIVWRQGGEVFVTIRKE